MPFGALLLNVEPIFLKKISIQRVLNVMNGLLLLLFVLHCFYCLFIIYSSGVILCGKCYDFHHVGETCEEKDQRQQKLTKGEKCVFFFCICFVFSFYSLLFFLISYIFLYHYQKTSKKRQKMDQKKHNALSPL